MSSSSQAPLGESPRRPPGALPLLVVLGTSIALLIAGLKLRTETLPYHQNLWGIDWLSYYEAQGRGLRGLNPVVWLLSWEGLHPPVSGIAHGLIQALGGGLHVHWFATTLAGLTGATALALETWRRSGPLTPLLILGIFALSPMQVNYALNASPYPWTLLLIGLSSALLLRASEDGSQRLWLASGIASALASQVHVLALAAVGLQTLFLLGTTGWRPSSWSKDLRRWYLMVGLSALFLIGVSVFKTTDPWTFHIGDEQPWNTTALHMLDSRFGNLDGRLPLVFLLAGGFLAGLFTSQRRAVLLLGGQGLAMLVALVFFMEQQVADPRLTHYYVPMHLLFLSSGALGLGAVLHKAGPGFSGVILTLVLLSTGLGWSSASAWHQERHESAQKLVDNDTARAIEALYVDAGAGDVIAYLWDHQFLNDEPEHLDPIAARWPTSRLGRPCFDIEAPRMQCNSDGEARFYFDPRSHHTDFDGLEETLRLVINSAHPPGQARLVVAPSEDTPPRPWPVEPWFLKHGGILQTYEHPTLLLWTFPVGLKIPAPPPLHPAAPEVPSEE